MFNGEMGKIGKNERVKFWKKHKNFAKIGVMQYNDVIYTMYVFCILDVYMVCIQK